LLIDDKFVVVCSYRCTNELGEVIIQSTTGMLCFLCFIVYFCFCSVIRKDRLQYDRLV